SGQSCARNEGACEGNLKTDLLHISWLVSKPRRSLPSSSFEDKGSNSSGNAANSLSEKADGMGHKASICSTLRPCNDSGIYETPGGDMPRCETHKYEIGEAKKECIHKAEVCPVDGCPALPFMAFLPSPGASSIRRSADSSGAWTRCMSARSRQG
ncbi:unnamed protein product, partial [Chrysoparadoxa australica]